MSRLPDQQQMPMFMPQQQQQENILRLMKYNNVIRFTKFFLLKNRKAILKILTLRSTQKRHPVLQPYDCLSFSLSSRKRGREEKENIFSALSKDFGFLLYFGGLLGNIYALEILKPKIFHGQNFHKLCMTPNALANAG